MSLEAISASNTPVRIPGGVAFDMEPECSKVGKTGHESALVIAFANDSVETRRPRCGSQESIFAARK